MHLDKIVVATLHVERLAAIVWFFDPLHIYFKGFFKLKEHSLLLCEISAYPFLLVKDSHVVLYFGKPLFRPPEPGLGIEALLSIT